MCYEDLEALSFETLITDPLTRLVMESDGVTTVEMVAILELVGAAVIRREHAAQRACVGHA